MPRIANKARDLGLDLNTEALERLEELPGDDAFTLMQQVASRGGAIRNPSTYVIRTIERGFDPEFVADRVSLKCAENLGIELDDACRDLLTKIPLDEAMQLLDSVAMRGGKVRNPVGYIASACEKILAGKGGGAIGKGQAKGSSKYGLASWARAEELGLDLDSECYDALATVPRKDAFELLDSIEAKGAGRNGGIRNPSAYVLKACESIAASNSSHGAHAKGQEAKSRGKGKAHIRYDFEESEEGKSRGKGRAHLRNDLEEIEVRVAGLNQSGRWNGDKIDVEALLALKTLDPRDAIDLLDSLEGKFTVSNPSKWLTAAVNRISSNVVGSDRKDEGGKRPQTSAHREAPRPQKRSRMDKPTLAYRAWELGVDMNSTCMAKLSEEPEHAAMALLSQVEENRHKIKNVDNYILSACNRGIST